MWPSREQATVAGVGLSRFVKFAPPLPKLEHFFLTVWHAVSITLAGCVSTLQIASGDTQPVLLDIPHFIVTTAEINL